MPSNTIRLCLTISKHTSDSEIQHMVYATVCTLSFFIMMWQKFISLVSSRSFHWHWGHIIVPVYLKRSWNVNTPHESIKIKPWASCHMRKIAGAHAPGMAGRCSAPLRVSNPDMHHGTCVTHVPWCTPGSLTSGFLWSRRRGKTFPAFPAHAQPAVLRIW